MPELHDIVERKFVESYDVNDWEILTDEGFSDISQLHKTIPYEVWEVITTNHSLKCADTHILFDENLNEVFAKDLIPQQSMILTDSGPEVVQQIINHGYEDNMFDLTVNDDNHRYYTNGILSHNTITTAAFILWYAFFNPDKTVAILANKAAIAREILNRIVAAYETIPFFLQPGAKVLNKGSLELGNNSRIIASSTSADSIRGYSVNLLFLDEFAFVDNSVEFFKSTFPTISSGEETKIIIASTPNGLNLFYRLFSEAKAKQNDFFPFEISWNQVPGRDIAWAKAQTEILGDLGFRQEYGNEFLGSANTLIMGSKLRELYATVPISSDFNTVINHKPQEGHSYACMVDVAGGSLGDYSSITIIDTTEMPYRVAYTWKCNKTRPYFLAQTVMPVCEKYNNAFLVIERNSIGRAVAEECHFEYGYEYLAKTFVLNKRQILSSGFVKNSDSGVEMTKSVKRLGCAVLKDLIEEDKLIDLTHDQIHELSNFISKADSYSADTGIHDDLVMNLVMFAWMSTQSYFKEMKNANSGMINVDDGDTQIEYGQIFRDESPMTQEQVEDMRWLLG